MFFSAGFFLQLDILPVVNPLLFQIRDLFLIPHMSGSTKPAALVDMEMTKSITAYGLAGFPCEVQFPSTKFIDASVVSRGLYSRKTPEVLQCRTEHENVCLRS